MPVLPGTGARSLAVAVVVAVVIAGYVLLARHTADETAAPDGRSGFQERAREAKLAFRMHDLPKEQGERFGINLYDHGSGLAVGDYDDDGREDIYFLNQLGPNALYRNRGDGTFVDVTAQAGVALGDRISVAATFADYDNDGWADLFVTTTRGGHVLWPNGGDGTVEDVTAAAGLSHIGHSQTPVFFDYDNDGYLDLFLTNTAQWTTDVFDSAAGYFEGKADLEHLQTSPTESNILYHNNGDGAFTDQTDHAGLRGRGWAGDVAVFDYDEDGFLDLFVPSMFGRGQLYRNSGQGKFTETAVAAGLETLWPWGVATGDFDNDGHEDVFITSGMGYPFYYWPNQLMMNNGDGTFHEQAAALGVEPPTDGIYLEESVGGQRAARSSRSAVVADFDGDGRLEIVTNNFNDRPYFFANRFPRRNYIEFRLTGTRSNRDAIGAVVRLRAGNTVMVRQVSPAGGYLAQSSRVVHFGLGERSKVDRIEIRWPRGTVQTLDNPAINTLHQIREPAH